MQNLGFAYALIPLLGSASADSRRTSQMLDRHLQSFSTHPYLSGPVLGSVVRLEEGAGDGTSATELKKTLMGPYAAMGDTFFWGAWRPFLLIAAVLLAREGRIWAPLLFLALYNPVPFYVRLKGFAEGYRMGVRGIEFIGRLNLPGLAGKVRWLSVPLLALLAVALYRDMRLVQAAVPDLLIGFLLPGIVLLCVWMINRRISVMTLLYGAAALLVLISL